MSTHNICFHGEIRKISKLFSEKKAISRPVRVNHKLKKVTGFLQEQISTENNYPIWSCAGKLELVYILCLIQISRQIYLIKKTR